MKALLVSLLIYLIKVNSFGQNSFVKCPATAENSYYDTGIIIKTQFIDSVTRGYFVKGDAISFVYNKYFDCPEIFDEEYADNLGWSMPITTSDSFKYVFNSSDKLPDNIAYCLRYGRWGAFYSLSTISGNLFGKKVGNEWNISANLSVTAVNNTN